MEHFVTLFDRRFLPQGLALHGSLERHASPHTLWVLCVDDTVYEVLDRLRLSHTRLLKLADVETSDLVRVKPGRSRTEYCWTLTPFTPRFVFEAEPTARRVTYVDADLWFRNAPAPIFRELEASQKHVLITDHGYAPQHDHTASHGRYCVQFVTFTREGGEPVRKWWEERCVEWCFARLEDGKFGDQKYLDDWPQRFGNAVHVLQHREWTQAPWNAVDFASDRAVFYHFHGLRLLVGDRANLGGYPLPRGVIEEVYLPYLDSLAAALRALRAVGFQPRPQEQNALAVVLKSLLFRIFPWRRRFVILPMRSL